jgi:hypothetical protein
MLLNGEHYSFLSTDPIRGMLYTMAGAVLGAVVIEIMKSKFSKVPWHFIYPWLIVPFIGLSFFGGWWFGFPHIQKYPRLDGLIADFTGGLGAPARNAFGEPFNIILDSDNNLDSKCWYKCSGTGDGNGFLRIFYELSSGSKDAIPYCGVFTSFTHYPSQPLDVSRFSSIRLKLRLSQPNQEPKICIVVVLCTANVQGAGWYDYCEYQIPDHELQTEWVDVQAPFKQMLPPTWAPPWRREVVKLDATKAFQISVAVKGYNGGQAHGYFDVDDIRFSN